MSVNEKMTAIADTIRAYTDGTEQLGLEEMAQQVQTVYLSGVYDAAYRAGSEDGQQAGIQAGQDAMWDYIQDHGNRTDYRYAFFYTGFQHIDPKYRITAANAESFMANMSSLETVNWDKLDLSAASSLYCAFGFCTKLTEVDTDLGLRAETPTLFNAIFRNCTSLTSVKKITAYPAAVWKNSFDGCTALTHVIFDGTIGANGLNLQWSTGLDKESITSIINALDSSTTFVKTDQIDGEVSDWEYMLGEIVDANGDVYYCLSYDPNTGDDIASYYYLLDGVYYIAERNYNTTGCTITLSETAVANAFPKDDPEGEMYEYAVEWHELIATKPNWTINLV